MLKLLWFLGPEVLRSTSAAATSLNVQLKAQRAAPVRPGPVRSGSPHPPVIPSGSACRSQYHSWLTGLQPSVMDRTAYLPSSEIWRGTTHRTRFNISRVQKNNSVSGSERPKVFRGTRTKQKPGRHRKLIKHNGMKTSIAASTQNQVQLKNSGAGHSDTRLLLDLWYRPSMDRPLGGGLDPLLASIAQILDRTLICQ